GDKNWDNLNVVDFFSENVQRHYLSSVISEKSWVCSSVVDLCARALTMSEKHDVKEPNVWYLPNMFSKMVRANMKTRQIRTKLMHDGVDFMPNVSACQK
ncbi:unnamed protein product, partial [Linum tenue]